MITKEVLIYLFEKKDPSRKRSLYRLYKPLIDSDASRAFVVKSINEDLGKEGLISVLDIKYCRAEFKEKNIVHEVHKKVSKPTNEIPIIREREERVMPDFDIQLTDPDEISTNQNILKSKHSVK